MGERFNLKSIWKSNDPEELRVFYAGSLDNEIRFYFNDEQYVAARENKDGTFAIKYEGTDKIILSDINYNLLFKYLAFEKYTFFLLVTLMIVSAIAIVVLIDSLLNQLLMINSIVLFI